MLNLGFGGCSPSPLEDVHHAADEPGQQEEASRDSEARVVVSSRLKYPSWGMDVFQNLIDVYMNYH